MNACADHNPEGTPQEKEKNYTKIRLCNYLFISIYIDTVLLSASKPPCASKMVCLCIG